MTPPYTYTSGDDITNFTNLTNLTNVSSENMEWNHSNSTVESYCFGQVNDQQAYYIFLVSLSSTSVDFKLVAIKAS